jgi:hypothetical protein
MIILGASHSLDCFAVLTATFWGFTGVTAGRASIYGDKIRPNQPA